MKRNEGVEKNVVKTAASACVKACHKLAAQLFKRTKESLSAELRETYEVPEKLFGLALNEAEALAWQTEYPHLLFPDLAAEKVRAVAGWNAHQQFIRRKYSGGVMSN
jgi:hypothetical protein